MCKSQTQILTNALNKFKDATELFEIMVSFKELKDACLVSEGDDVYQKLKNATMHQAFWCRKMWETLDEKRKAIGDRCSSIGVGIVGSGPGGLSTAIECAVIGAKVLVLEKRSYFSRNNILHLWPYTMEYLKNISMKTFYPHFGTGAIDHIGTKQIQRGLMKVALLFGVEFVFGVGYEGVIADGEEWRFNNIKDVEFKFSVLVGADGEHSTVANAFNFEKKDFSGSLSIGITANFVNLRQQNESTLREFGLSYVFQQKLFNEIKEKHCADLENLVYYRGETHYLVMTAKKENLIEREIFKYITPDTDILTKPENINTQKLCEYVRGVANACDIPADREFYYNTMRKSPDIQLFNFTKQQMAKSAVKTFRDNPNDNPLYIALIGDALLQPFWPLGTGCNKAILSAQDTAWMVMDIVNKLEEQEVIKRRNDTYSSMRAALAASINTPYCKATINPLTRYSKKSFVGFQ